MPHCTGSPSMDWKSTDKKWFGWSSIQVFWRFFSWALWTLLNSLKSFKSFEPFGYLWYDGDINPPAPPPMSMKNCPSSPSNPHIGQVRAFFLILAGDNHSWTMSYHILKLEYCFDLPPIVVCSGRSIPWILSFPLYSIFLRPIVCSHWDIANVTLFCICNGPHYPLHCVQYYPCFVRKCAKYQHINTEYHHRA